MCYTWFYYFSNVYFMCNKKNFCIIFFGLFGHLDGRVVENSFIFGLSKIRTIFLEFSFHFQKEGFIFDKFDWGFLHFVRKIYILSCCAKFEQIAWILSDALSLSICCRSSSILSSRIVSSCFEPTTSHKIWSNGPPDLDLPVKLPQLQLLVGPAITSNDIIAGNGVILGLKGFFIVCVNYQKTPLCSYFFWVGLIP